MAPCTSPSGDVYDQLAALLSPPGAYPAARYRSSSEIADGQKRIRRIILTEGIPEPDGRPSLRPRIWKLLLKVDHLGAEDYLRYVGLGPSAVSLKIKEDTNRTFRTDSLFQGRVQEEMLIRLLEAFAWKSQCTTGERSFTYVQGMNALAAPFLYVMPSQLEAFACFAALVERGIPQFVLGTNTEGAIRGAEILDKCLRIVDPELEDHLRGCHLTGQIYAFPSVLTMCACTPPLEEVIRLWDFLLAFGVHLNILCIIAQLLLIREDLMATKSPMKLLRTFPPLKARAVIGITLALVKDIPEDVYKELVAHPVHPVHIAPLPPGM
ncbi:hypothetical protein CcaverHIS002_0102580 [Cutaneotrichosporon cavernicola]|uniref:Rab-GAP TBC domain-containing protein n=1 Tax=Cutaneotrichosporon cavernicola TaxID=279322 RepID=A0AA48HXW2_9TREE|nr:uncharacterized protein CcaverHIS019_0102520 [Cutaneotrichosporon cavernicola]BEI79729.1 hypothetical protein CcaverHIS002_0102580 [Cutaneotrichosporon cavernicola]BEI87534.1 hypothetical protein CcaverHIS019_0102520 [Cutaneotrichosporon cavernicola]BEI95306.1 hypothetical protein CcaverHIS631_0102550 [Cutaneotrichosporon cavernicola]BEJ03079.1 hypothetical protein CcaverHIS641_0102540 [Cutaneotrichosporon cavernicola]